MTGGEVPGRNLDSWNLSEGTDTKLCSRPGFTSWPRNALGTGNRSPEKCLLWV